MERKWVKKRGREREIWRGESGFGERNTEFERVDFWVYSLDKFIRVIEYK
jgi:hypothetical protein